MRSDLVEFFLENPFPLTAGATLLTVIALAGNARHRCQGGAPLASTPAPTMSTTRRYVSAVGMTLVAAAGVGLPWLAEDLPVGQANVGLLFAGVMAWFTYMSLVMGRALDVVPVASVAGRPWFVWWLVTTGCAQTAAAVTLVAHVLPQAVATAESIALVASGSIAAGVGAGVVVAAWRLRLPTRPSGTVTASA